MSACWRSRGRLRLGAVVKNIREPEFDAPGLTPDAPPTRSTMPRQMRVGVAFDSGERDGAFR